MKKVFLFLGIIMILPSVLIAGTPDGMTTCYTETPIEHVVSTARNYDAPQRATITTRTEIWKILAPELEARSVYGKKRVALISHPSSGSIREIPLDQLIGNRTSGIGSIPPRVNYVFITFVNDTLSGVVFIFPMDDTSAPAEKEKSEVLNPQLLTATKP